MASGVSVHRTSYNTVCEYSIDWKEFLPNLIIRCSFFRSIWNRGQGGTTFLELWKLWFELLAFGSLVWSWDVFGDRDAGFYGNFLRWSMLRMFFPNRFSCWKAFSIFRSIFTQSHNKVARIIFCKVISWSRWGDTWAVLALYNFVPCFQSDLALRKQNNNLEYYLAIA